MGLLALSVIPAIILLVLVYRADQADKEPPKLLLKLFVFGMLSTFGAMILEYLLSAAIEPLSSNTLAYNLVMYFLVVAVSEEGMKYLFLRTVRKSPSFNYTFDGIVYAVCVGLGFAALENIMYVVGYGSAMLGVVRGLTAVPLHCTCAVFMGYYFGLAHRAASMRATSRANGYTALALIVPIFLHGFYDFSVSSENDAMMIVAFIFTILIFILAIRRVRRSSSADAPIIPPLPR